MTTVIKISKRAIREAFRDANAQTRAAKPMKKYSAEWKQAQGAWIQDHVDAQEERIYRIHYIENDTEYSQRTDYYTRKEAQLALAEFRADRGYDE